MCSKLILSITIFILFNSSIYCQEKLDGGKKLIPLLFFEENKHKASIGRYNDTGVIKVIELDKVKGENGSGEPKIGRAHV